MITQLWTEPFLVAAVTTRWEGTVRCHVGPGRCHRTSQFCLEVTSPGLGAGPRRRQASAPPFRGLRACDRNAHSEPGRLCPPGGGLDGSFPAVTLSRARTPQLSALADLPTGPGTRRRHRKRRLIVMSMERSELPHASSAAQTLMVAGFRYCGRPPRTAAR